MESATYHHLKSTYITLPSRAPWTLQSLSSRPSHFRTPRALNFWVWLTAHISQNLLHQLLPVSLLNLVAKLQQFTFYKASKYNATPLIAKMETNLFTIPGKLQSSKSLSMSLIYSLYSNSHNFKLVRLQIVPTSIILLTIKMTIARRFSIVPHL